MNAPQKSYGEGGSDPRLPVGARTARPDARSVATERAESADEALRGLADFVVRRRHEMAGHKAMLRAEECARERLREARHPGACDADDGDCAGEYRSDLVGSSAPMRKLAAAILRLAPLTSTVLILGETGTGKELVARAVHLNSPRSHKPFVAVNCNSLTETIFDSQLMGHVRGAFTGAHRDEPGAVRAAASGTLFLDEIGDVPLTLQGKLLRVLQERVVTPLGTHREYRVDVRFVAATNKDLAREVREGRFREDLYRRLRVQEIVTPPLRERLDDVPELVRHFESKLPAEMRLIAPPAVTSEAVDVLRRHDWPGNVRELENAMERAVALEPTPSILPDSLPELVRSGSHAVAAAATQEADGFPAAGFDLEQHVKHIEKEYIAEALRRAGGVKVRAAELLGMSFRSFRYYTKKYNLK